MTNDHNIMITNLWNIQKHVRMTPSIGFGVHRILTTDFLRLMDIRQILYQNEKIKMWKLKYRVIKENFKDSLKTKLPTHNQRKKSERDLMWASYKQQRRYAAKEMGENTRKQLSYNMQ